MPTEMPEMLAQVKARGRQIRRRRRTAQATGSLSAVAAVAIGATALLSGAGPEVADDVAVSAPTTTIASIGGFDFGDRSGPEGGEPGDGPPMTVEPGGGVAIGGGGSGGGAGSSPDVAPFLPPAASPSGPRTCVQSYDPDCGPMRWEPTPDNAPLELTLEASMVVVRGQEIEVEVTASDPDAHVDLTSCDTRWNWDDGTTHDNDPDNDRAPCPQYGQGQPRYGIWPTPPPRPSTDERTFTHTFDEPGSYEVIFRVASTGEPYASSATRRITITVL